MIYTVLVRIEINVAYCAFNVREINQYVVARYVGV